MSDKFVFTKEDAAYLQEDTCDMGDYLTSVACGAVAGLIDIFFVGAPGNSKLGTWTDAKTDSVVMRFAKLTGWSPKPGNETNIGSAIGFLESKFKVNYDQRYAADIGGAFSMSTKNHHIKSLSHSPDPVGLFFSVLNQFTNTSSFVSDGKLITIQTDTFELYGSNLLSKLFCGIANWFGHIMSDVAGSSGSRGNAGRGTGVAIPFYELLQFCNFGKFQISEARQDLATLSVRAFQEGYDARFGVTMAIPVILCDLSIRLIWAIKRHFKLDLPLKECLPDSKHKDLRTMLLFGHGTLCLMDGIDAGIRSGGNGLLFFARLNLIAWVRFATLVLKEICIRTGIALPLQESIDAYKRLTVYMQHYYEELQKIDVERFQRETEEYNQWSRCLKQASNEEQLNVILLKAMDDLGISLPWTGDFDSFMRDKTAHLVFQ